MHEAQISFDEYEAQRRLLEVQLKQREDARSRMQLGVLYAQRGMLDAARDALSVALRDDSCLAEAYYWLAQVHVSQGNADGALVVLQRGSKEGARNPALWRMLAVLQRYHQGDSTAAQRSLQRYLELGGDASATSLQSLMR